MDDKDVANSSNTHLGDVNESYKGGPERWHRKQVIQDPGKVRRTQRSTSYHDTAPQLVSCQACALPEKTDPIGPLSASDFDGEAHAGQVTHRG